MIHYASNHSPGKHGMGCHLRACSQGTLIILVIGLSLWGTSVVSAAPADVAARSHKATTPPGVEQPNNSSPSIVEPQLLWEHTLEPSLWVGLVLEPATPSLGERFSVRLLVKTSPGVWVEYPEQLQADENLSVIDVSKDLHVLSTLEVMRELEVQLEATSDGLYHVGPWEIRLVDPASKQDRLVPVPAVFIPVHSVLPHQFDTGSVRPPTGILVYGPTSPTRWILAAGAATLVALLVLAIFWRGRRTPAVSSREAPVYARLRGAIDELERATGNSQWAASCLLTTAEYLRQWLGELTGNRFSQTSLEILDGLRHLKWFSDGDRSVVEKVLRVGDQLKFAGRPPREPLTDLAALAPVLADVVQRLQQQRWTSQSNARQAGPP